FLARRPDQTRKLVNYAAIETIAAARGFAIVYPQDLSFAEQYNLMRGARHLLGPEGSAFYLAYFLREGSKAAILNHSITEPQTLDADLHRARGVDLTVLTGPIDQPAEAPGWAHHASYSIDEATLTAFLDVWLAE